MILLLTLLENNLWQTENAKMKIQNLRWVYLLFEHYILSVVKYTGRNRSFMFLSFCYNNTVTNVSYI